MKPRTATTETTEIRKSYIVEVRRSHPLDSQNYTKDVARGREPKLKTFCCAVRRALASASNTFLIDSRAPQLVSVTVSSITLGIWSNRILPSRNAATAISSAAFRATVLAPPASAASYARRRQGNFFRSGGLKSR